MAQPIQTVTNQDGSITTYFDDGTSYTQPSVQSSTRPSAQPSTQPSVQPTSGYGFGDYLVDSMPAGAERDAYLARMQSDPQSQAPTNAYLAAGGQPIFSQYGAIKQNQGTIDNTTSSLNNQINALRLMNWGTDTANQQAVARMGGLIDAQDPNNANYVAQSRALANELGGYRDTANQDALSSLGSYTSGLDALNAYNMQSVGNLEGLYGQLETPLQSQVSWAGDLTSQAAQADPQALAAQGQALGMLGSAASGGLDWESQAAQAYADPRYLAMRDQGLADLYSTAQGSRDVHPGQEDPAAYAAAMSALQQYGDLTTPRVTDAERFLYEQARQQQEQDERALSAARMTNLRQRGMAGSGAELTQGALDQQRISQNRLLSDLGAGYGAVNRSMAALQGYGNLGSALNAQANALAEGNSNRQLAALGAYTSGSDSAQASSFDQAYKRGLGADQASQSNQATRLGGMVAYGNQANAMQDDAFNRGAAADQTAQFNRAMSIDVAKFNSTYAQDERDAQWNRGMGLTGAQLNASAQNSNNLSNKFTGQQGVIQDVYGRNRDVVSAQDVANTRENTGQNQQLDRRLGVQGTQIGVNNNTLSNNIGIGQLGLNATQWGGGATIANTSQLGGYYAGQGAMSAAQAQADAQKKADANKGILGLPYIGSQNDPMWVGNWFRGKTGPE